jgi:hypothetical protein
MWVPRLPQQWPKGYSLNVQRNSEGPGHVVLVHYFEPGMKFASQVGRAYGETLQAAWDAAVLQVVKQQFNKL